MGVVGYRQVTLAEILVAILGGDGSDIAYFFENAEGVDSGILVNRVQVADLGEVVPYLWFVILIFGLNLCQRRQGDVDC